MKRSLLLTLAALVIAGLLATLHAANQPYAIARGLNGTWAYVSCYDGSNNSTSCTDHWVIGSGSQDPSNAYGNDGDLFWRTDLKAFRTKTAGVWGAASVASSSFPLLAPGGSLAAPSYSFSDSPTSGMHYSVGGNYTGFKGRDRTGTDLSGGSVFIDGGAGTGSGSGGNVSLTVAPPGTSGSSQNPPLTMLTLSGVNGTFTAGGATLVDASATTNELIGQSSSASNAAGGGIRIRGGNATAGNANGGSVTIGNSTGIGTGVAGHTFLAGRTFASLGTPANGAVAFCSDCTIANPCASGGTGAMAKRLNAVWVCN